ncbi:hypothetical protein HUT16_37215 [Kitasatospora sp. NA04385]|uniref:hypothetical protein n=1 Tax=Kitasatospora sp. NA04385 TaxID=2742135 RepID=UPI001591C3EE|nr:hypothetical protein [Kitasatospora sp. NA04385]QKW23975.1 hypothetical protein HUT16_37215 [Kitasatospora sp. NA04385]
MTAKPARLRTALFGATVLVAITTGCTSSTGDRAEPTTQPSRTPSAPSPITPSTTAPPTIPELPPAEPGVTTLASVPLRTAGTSVANLSVKAGELTVTILCTGGTLTLHMEPVSTTTIPCAVGSVTPSRNSFHLGSPKDINVSVDAPETVQWNMRIEQ